MIAAVYPYFLFSMLLGLSISSVACSITSTERTQFSHYFIDSFLYNIENKTVVHQFFFLLLLLLRSFFIFFSANLQAIEDSLSIYVPLLLYPFHNHFNFGLLITLQKKEKKYMIKNRLMWFLLDFINFVDKNGENVIQSTRIYNRISCTVVCNYRIYAY